MREDRPTRRLSAERAAPLAAAVALFTIYLATLAPDVTFWDAGEFIAAVETLGIPHPPGTPLYILVARAWRLLIAPVPSALAVNLFSAVCTAAAGGLTATIVTRATGIGAYGAAAALAAGTMSTVWLNATETEVYAVSLCLSVLMLWAADRAGRIGDSRWVVLTGYVVALSAPLHVSALVAAPGAALLAASREDGTIDRTIALALGAVALLSGGVGTGSVVVTIAGAAALFTVVALPRGRLLVPRLAVVSLCAFSVLAFLLVRAKHDPAINQGNPSTLETLWEVIARRQYAIAPLWPRQAPAWLQLGNLLEYVDWQVGVGLAPLPPPSPWRTPLTIAAIVLAAIGSRAHRARDVRSWRAHLLVLVCGTLGVLAYLNLKAGPSIGYGILPDGAPHEARERDYFFALGFWVWGTWMGMGAVEVVARRRWGWPLGVALAALPLLLNWSAVNRRREPDASAASVVAASLLEDAPPGAVLLAGGDNDTYPLWYLQRAGGLRRDVTVVTLPLLGADWYRQELARRHTLVSEQLVRQWLGLGPTLRDVAAHATAHGRPVVASPLLTADERELLPRWELAGTVYRWSGEVDVTPRARAARTDSSSAATRRSADRGARWLGATPVTRYTDFTTSRMRFLLACPTWALAAERSAPAADSLASLCNFR